MHSFFKFMTLIGIIFSILVFAVISFAEMVIPDEITVVENGNYKVPDIFGFEVYSLASEREIGVSLSNINDNDRTTEIKLLNIIPIKRTVITTSKREYVVLGGEVFGIKLYTDGVIVVDMEDIETADGKVNPAKNAGIKIGDVVKSVNNVEVTSSSHLSKLLQQSKGNEIKISLIRNGKKIECRFKTVKETESNCYRAGLWVRDSTAGLGTVTFYNKSNNGFAGLGHPIYDVDTNEIMPIKTGIMAEAKVSGLYKSSFGNVGELCGTLTGKNCGILSINSNTGIYGYCICKDNEMIPVALRQEVKEGKAQIRCTIDNNKPKYYDIEITKIYSNSQSVNKDMIIKVTDSELLKKTGGIVQGMSGSPIIQDGMLVGAVTHVFVNNPKQGYAIFAERMFETSNSQEKISEEKLKNVS